MEIKVRNHAIGKVEQLNINIIWCLVEALRNGDNVLNSSQTMFDILLLYGTVMSASYCVPTQLYIYFVRFISLD